MKPAFAVAALVLLQCVNQASGQNEKDRPLPVPKILKLTPLTIDSRTEARQRVNAEEYNKALSQLHAQYLLFQEKRAAVNALGAAIDKFDRALANLVGSAAQPESPGIRVMILELVQDLTQCVEARVRAGHGAEQDGGQAIAMAVELRRKATAALQAARSRDGQMRLWENKPIESASGLGSPNTFPVSRSRPTAAGF